MTSEQPPSFIAPSDQERASLPTPGEWYIERTFISIYIRSVQGGPYIAHLVVPYDDWRKTKGTTRVDADARLIVAAGTAAHRIWTELGFDPVEVFQMLPDWLSNEVDEADRREIERQLRAANKEEEKK